MAGGVSVQKSPLENARRLLSQLVAAWVERGGRGRRPSSAGPKGVEGQLLREEAGAHLGTRVPDTLGLER